MDNNLNTICDYQENKYNCFRRMYYLENLPYQTNYFSSNNFTTNTTSKIINLPCIILTKIIICAIIKISKQNLVEE